MRNYLLLDVASVDENNLLSITSSSANEDQPTVTMIREGAFVAFSSSIGPIELAIRFRYQDFIRHLKNLHPVAGLAVTRQVGSANSYLSFGLSQQQQLVLRPTIVSDASGHFSINLLCSSEVRQAILEWVERE